MRAVTVYRVDYARRTKDPIGALLEKRGSERAHNRAILPELTSDCSGGSFEEEEKRKKMKRVMIVLTFLFAVPVSAFTEMSNRQGGGMMNGGWWWGMNSGWYFMFISAILIIFGIFMIMKRGE